MSSPFNHAFYLIIADFSRDGCRRLSFGRHRTGNSFICWQQPVAGNYLTNDLTIVLHYDKNCIYREVKLKIKIYILLTLMHFFILPAEQGSEKGIRGVFSIGYDAVRSDDVLKGAVTLPGEGISGQLDHPREKIRKKKFWRAAAYMGTIWVIDSVRYWATYAEWIEDWQYQLSWEDQKRRFFSLEANRFDSNPFQTNWGHGVGGAVYFNLARYHNLNLFESVLFESGTSLIWEYFTEWREVVSLNDNFFSGLGGMPIGEPFYQIGKYLLSRKGAVTRVAGYLLNPIMGACDLFGGKKWRSSFTENYESSPVFKLSLSNENISFSDRSKDSGNRFRLNMGSEFLKIPGYGQPGNERVNSGFTTTFYSSIDFAISIGNGPVEEYKFDTKVIYFGFIDQHIKQNGTGKLDGYSFYLGASSAYSFYKRRAIEAYDTGQYHYDFDEDDINNDEDGPDNFVQHSKPPQPVNFTDKMAVINLLGPASSLTLYASPFELNFSADAYFDFGLINSFALNRYSEEHDIFEPRMKTTLSYYGYYYAFGTTLNLGTRLRIGALSLAGGYRLQRYASIQGLDRFQDRIRDDNTVRDSRSVLNGSLEDRIPGSGISISCLIRKINRTGTLNGLSVNEKETKILSSLNIYF